jgi:hypothetical protein
MNKLRESGMKQWVCRHWGAISAVRRRYRKIPLKYLIRMIGVQDWEATHISTKLKSEALPFDPSYSFRQLPMYSQNWKLLRILSQYKFSYFIITTNIDKRTWYLTFFIVVPCILIILKLFLPKNALFIKHIKYYNLQLKLLYIRSYMFRSIRAILREPTLILAKVTLLYNYQ